MMVDTTDIEKKSLEAHVELCAERYKLLENRIDSMIVCIDEIKNDVKQMHGMIQIMSEKRNDQIISWGLGVGAVMLSIIGYLIATFVVK
jgi:hypothetical protein